MDPKLTHDLTVYVGPLLSVLGGGLQFLRAFKKFDDFWYGMIALGCAVAAYGLTHRFSPGDVQYEVVIGIITAAGYVASIAGGTFIVASAANAAPEAAKSRALVPATNSKGADPAPAQGGQ